MTHKMKTSPSGRSLAHLQQTAAFPLMALPCGMVAAHVLPFLTPWGRTQLRNASAELCSIVDSCQTSILHTFLPEEELTALEAADCEAMACDSQAHASPESLGDAIAQECPNLQHLCGLLKSSAHVRVLRLQLAGVKMQLPRAAARALRTASSGRVRRLSIVHRFGQQVHPSILGSLSELAPVLQELELDLSWQHCSCTVVGEAEEWAAAVASLPHSLRSLSISLPCDAAAATHCWAPLAAALNQAGHHLPHLTHLRLTCRSGTLDLAPLGPAVRNLRRLEIDANDRVSVVGLTTLLDACRDTLHELDMPVPASAEELPLAFLLPLTPFLRGLTLSHAKPHALSAALSREDADAMADLQHLARLKSASSAYLCTAGAALRPTLARLRELQLGTSMDVSEWARAGLLSQGGLHPSCHITFDWGAGLQLGTSPLDTATCGMLAAALRTVGVSTRRQDGDLHAPALHGTCAVALTTAEAAAAGPEGEGDADVYAGNHRLPPACVAAVSQVLAQLQGLHLANGCDAYNVLSRQLAEECRAVANAVATGDVAQPGWLLHAMAHMSTLVLRVPSGTHQQILTDLDRVLTSGHLPGLKLVVLQDVMKISYPGPCEMMGTVGHLMLAHPKLAIQAEAPALRPASIDLLRSVLPGVLEPAVRQVLCERLLA